MEKNIISIMKPHLKPMFLLICEKMGMEGTDAPKVVFHNEIQKGSDPLLVKTGYFDPNTDKIHLFVFDNSQQRAVKDIMRSFAHECIHYLQQKRGDIENSGYFSDKITEDEQLINLEKEAYLKGNIIFRTYTENYGKKK